MKIADWLTANTKVLKQAGIPTPRLDCLVLLGDVLGKDRAALLAHPETVLNQAQLDKLRTQLEERSQHVPLAFIRGRSEFYGHDFIVTTNVLEPRPESEAIIDLLKKIDTPGAIIDVGTGSGALAISAALEIPTATVYAVDIDPECLTVAQKNAAKHKVDVSFYEGNLLEPVERSVLQDATLLANLPYVPNDHALNKAARHEPALAIFGGKDGLDLYRTLFAQISDDAQPRYILAESLPAQHTALAELAAEHGYAQTVEEDFIQLFTVSALLPA